MFFFIIPVGVEYRARRYPAVTFTLMGICVMVHLVIFVLGLAFGEGVYEWVYDNLWLTPAKSHWWTYITSLFCHGGFLHLLGNMIYLFLFGACVEDHIGRVRFSLFFLVTGVLSCFGHIAGQPGHFASEIPLGGASGAISACIGGFVLLLPKTRIEFKWVFFFLFRIVTGEFYLPAWLVISFWFAMDLLGAVLTVASGEDSGGVAFAAHVGGFLVGMAWVALERSRLRRGVEVKEARADVAMAAPVRTRYGPTAERPAVRIRKVEEPTVFLHMDGEQSGPYTRTQIQQMLGAGQIAADALYWQAGMEEWQPAEEMREPGSG